jgi:hypothetical protein
MCSFNKLPMERLPGRRYAFKVRMLHSIVVYSLVFEISDSIFVEYAFTGQYS